MNWFKFAQSQKSAADNLHQQLQPIIQQILKLFPETTGIELGGSAARNQLDSNPNKKSDIDVLIRLPQQLQPNDQRLDQLFKQYPKLNGRTVDFITTWPKGNYVGKHRNRWEENLPTPTQTLWGKPYDEEPDKQAYLQKLKQFGLL